MPFNVKITAFIFYCTERIASVRFVSQRDRNKNFLENLFKNFIYTTIFLQQNCHLSNKYIFAVFTWRIKAHNNSNRVNIIFRRNNMSIYHNGCFPTKGSIFIACPDSFMAQFVSPLKLLCDFTSLNRC